MNITPQGDTSTIGSLPHYWQHLLVLCLLLLVVSDIYIQLCDEHRHLQFVLLSLQCAAKLRCTDTAQFVRLIAVGIDRRSRITQSLHQCDVVVYIITDRVIVIVNQNSIRPALIGHLECLDKPVIARLAATAKSLLHHGVAWLVVANSLIHHVNHWQRVELLLCIVKPIGKGSKTLLCRQTFQPVRILSSPHQSVELVGEVVVLGIGECVFSATPVERATSTFYRGPL